MSKFTICFERLWLVRGLSPGPFEPGKPMFWVAGTQWNGSPAHATLFPSEEAAQRHIDDARHYKRAGFGRNSIVEAVPLEGALKTLGTVVEVRRALPPAEKGEPS